MQGSVKDKFDQIETNFGMETGSKGNRNYLKFNNGILIESGIFPKNAGNTEFTYIIPFKEIPSVTVTERFVVTTDQYNWQFADQTTTKCTIKNWYKTGFQYIAIGRWK